MVKNSPIKAVFFDAADTLFRVKEGVGNVYWGVAKKYGSNSTPEQIHDAFSKAFKSAPPMAFPGTEPHEREVLEKRWWYDIVEKVFQEVGMFERFEAYFDELFETFRSRAWDLFPETIEVLSSLRREGVTLGVISNFDSRIYNVCADLGITDYFDDFVISSEVGFAKPSPEIFSLALERNKVLPSESLHVGDSLNLDFYGAQAVGIRALLLDREGRYKSRLDISSVDNLFGIIDKVYGR
ncbi:MAG TPA: HAD-IA family hydrolase [Thermodesulfobacteriota bacterium]|nr:HAD-IA family hydrolase [Thermodesulfobacteriota bacterium]